MNKLKTSLFGVDFTNPIWVASGTYGYGRDYYDYIKPADLGAMVTKGTSLTPWPGNKAPRVFETPAGMLNSIGLQNPGIEHFLEEDLPWLAKQKAKVVVNVAGHSQTEYLEIVEKCQDKEGITALEINISCPNVSEGGMAFGTDPEIAHNLLAKIRKISQLPIIAKLSPNVTSITEIAKAVESAGVDAVSLVNTLTGMAIDVESTKPVLGNVIGGLSGPAIRPVAVRMVWQVSQAVDIPVIGIGGIMNTNDALEFFLAGASAIQIGTALFVDPHTPYNIMDGLNNYLERKGFDSINDIVGLAWRCKND